MVVIVDIGCLLIAFSQSVAMYWMTIHFHAILYIIFLFSSLSWLITLLFSSLCWYIVSSLLLLPLPESWYVQILLSGIFQEIMRYYLLKYLIQTWLVTFNSTIKNIFVDMEDVESNISMTVATGYGFMRGLVIYGIPSTFQSLNGKEYINDLCPEIPLLLIISVYICFLQAFDLIASKWIQKSMQMGTSISYTIFITSLCHLLLSSSIMFLNRMKNGCLYSSPIILCEIILFAIGLRV